MKGTEKYKSESSLAKLELGGGRSSLISKTTPPRLPLPTVPSISAITKNKKEKNKQIIQEMTGNLVPAVALYFAYGGVCTARTSSWGFI